MNKKGSVVSYLSGDIKTLFLLGIAAILIFVVIANGGIGKISDIVGFLVKIPTIVWVILIAIVALKLIFGGRR